MNNEHIWGSIERNQGTWCPYSTEESLKIEESYICNDHQVYLETCFGAIVYFSREEDLHYQLTPQSGKKKQGFRSVHRGKLGDQITLYWNTEFSRWDKTMNSQFCCSKVITIDQQPIEDSFIWQWCDLENEKYENALEGNWHPFSQETSELIETAYCSENHATIEIGLAQYNVGDWHEVYGVQTNLESGVKRRIRKGRTKCSLPIPTECVGEMCAFCTN